MSATSQRTAKVHWIRSNGFTLGLLLAVVAAFLFPEYGAADGPLRADILNMGGVALILFLQGLSLAVEKIRSGAGNWRLHLIIQSFTFLIFPLVGLGLNALFPYFWPGAPAGIQQGFLFLCVLPSTISTSVVLTAVAGGNTAGALFNAAFSNILGVVITPVLVRLLMESTGEAGSFGPLLLKIMALTLLPFALGMILRNLVKNWIDTRKIWVSRISNAVIIFIVYSAFCESVQDQVWVTHGLMITVQTTLLVLALFLGMSALIFGSCRILGLDREDFIAAYFCSVKKTLALGVPLAILIFGESAELSLILLPVMLYHPIQLVLNGILANHWVKRAPVTP